MVSNSPLPQQDHQEQVGEESPETNTLVPGTNLYCCEGTLQSI